MSSSTAILVSETVKKDVVYSAECFEKSPEQLDASTQLLVEYSVIALEAKLMSPGDVHDVIRYIDASIDVINGCLKIGAFVFLPAAPVLLAIAGVGAFIQFLMGLIPDDRPDPVVQKYKELEKVIHQLEDQMVAHFADLQSFITEHNFNVNITTHASTLMRFMRNCIRHQDEVDVENFSDAYGENPPLSLAYSMASLLDHQSTNPLVMAMSAEKVKTKATFNKWKTIITGILGEFLYIEAFASGLLKKSSFNRDLLVKQSNELTASLKKWEDEYKNDEEYWTELKTDFDDYITHHTNLNNIQKGLEIRKRLDGYLTNDAFYISVFNETKFDHDFTIYCSNEKDQLISAWNKGRCCAFVYRSRSGAKMGQNDFQNLKLKLQDCEDGKLRWNRGLKNIIKDQLLNHWLLTGYGFYCLLGWHCDPQIFFLNSPEPDWHYKGPGHITHVLMDRDGGKEQYNFIVGFN